MTLPIRLAALVVALAAAAGFTGDASAGGYVLTDLGTLEGGGHTFAYAINARGQVVGYSGTPPHAFLWENGVMTDLGTLGGTFSSAEDINDLGQIVGHSDLPGDLERHAFLWEDGTMTDLGALGGEWSWAKAINNLGQIVGYSDVEPGYEDPARAVLWDHGAIVDLGISDRFSVANDINDQGDVVGAYDFYPRSPNTDAFIWSDGVHRSLGSLGGRFTWAKSINESGQIVGWATTPELGVVRSFLWEAGHMTDLETPGYAWAVNEDGVIVGHAGHAFIQHPGAAAMDLHELTACAAGSAIREATDVNDAGQIVARWDGARDTAAAGLLTPADVVPCRKGNVGLEYIAGLPSPQGVADVTFVGGSSGDPVDRRLEVPANTSVALRVEPAPDTLAPHYAIWIYEGESRACSPVEVILRYQGPVLIGNADRCLPVANTIAPGSCPGPGIDVFGLGRLAGVTSRRLPEAKAVLFSLNPAPGFPVAPTDFDVTFPPGTFTVYSIVRDRHATGQLKVSVGNAIVVESMP